MVGIVIVAHGNLPSEFIKTANMILGEEIQKTISISITPKDSSDYVADQIKSAIKQVDDGDGVMIFTDMFGGTPSNISLSFLELGKVEVISGLNLPMMLQIATSREGVSLSELGTMLCITGRENISLASEYLKRKKRSPKDYTDFIEDNSGDNKSDGS